MKRIFKFKMGEEVEMWEHPLTEFLEDYLFTTNIMCMYPFVRSNFKVTVIIEREDELKNKQNRKVYK